MWRYERPQKGRTREFFQWNIDLIGLDSPEADAELAAIGAEFLARVGLTPELAMIRVNSRRLVDSELERVGIPPESRQKTIQLIDKLEKLPASEWEEAAKSLGLSEGQISLVRGLVKDEDLWKKSDELYEFFRAAEALGIREYVRFSPSTIRGLNYYTGIIFECFALHGNFRSVFAGGRYDNLVADVGGDPLPGVGFAMGDKVVRVVLEELGLLPDFSRLGQIDVFVTTFDRQTMPESFRTARALRQEGLRVTTYPGEARLGKQLKLASQLGARVAIILGPEEIEAGTIVVRDMDRQEQLSLPVGTLIGEIRRILAQTNPS
jgi:histidyl-tRNA synthetase